MAQFEQTISLREVLRLSLNDFGLRDECDTGKRRLVTYRRGSEELRWHKKFLKPVIF